MPAEDSTVRGATQPPPAGMDWRVKFGLGVTIGWIALATLYMSATVGWSEFGPGRAGDLGDFVQGVFAPLAFLWLVLGHFLQQGEISANTRAIELQEANMQRIELLSRRDSFFKLQDLVFQQLGSIMFFLYISVEGPAGNGNMNGEEMAAERQRMDQGDHALFIRRLLFLCLANQQDHARVREYFFGTEIRRRHTENFRTTYAKLIRLAREVDEDDTIVNAIGEGSAVGRMNALIETLLAQPGTAGA